MNWFEGWVDTQRYPLHELDNPARKALVEKARYEVDSLGVAEIKNFVTAAGLRRMVDESSSLEPHAYHNALMGNAYLDDPDLSLPEDHARRLMERTSLGAVGYDQIPDAHLLSQIYHWEPLMQFIGEVLGLPAIYRYADPMGALNVSVMKDGDYLRWHFDQTDFVSSLMIRNANEGGAFEHVPLIRHPGNENYERVQAVLKGSREGVHTLPNEPGSLVLFRGRWSLHRVTPIQGPVSRLIGLFGYDSKPGTVSSDYLRKIRYGRSTPMR